MLIEQHGAKPAGAPPWILAGFALAHLVIFAIVFQTIYAIGFTGIGLYFADMSRMFAHQVPYRDFVLEYPPFAIFFFAIPRLFGSTYAAYYRGFQVEIIVCDLIILATLDAIARARGDRPTTMLGAYTVFTLAVGPIISQQFDLFAAMLVLLAVYFAGRERRVAVWVLVALGTLTKLYPVMLAPVFLIGEFRRRDWKAIAVDAGIALATVLVVMLPLLVVAPTAIRTFFSYHAKRGIQVESSYAGVLLIADKLHWIYLGIESSFGSWNVTGQYADVAATVSTFVLLAALIVTLTYLYRIRADGRGLDGRGAGSAHSVIGQAVLVVVFAILVTSKVLSPQYLMWALPLVPLVRGTNRLVIWGLFAVAGMMTFYIFPAHYEQLVLHDSSSLITVLVIRNLILAALGILVAASLRDVLREGRGNLRGAVADSTR